MPKPNPDRGGPSRLRQSAPLVVSAIALALAAGGIGVGAGALITGADIKNGSITGADIKSGSIAGDDIKSGAIQVSDLSKGAVSGLDGKDGTLHLVDPSPDGYKELAQAKVLVGRELWAPLALSDGKLLLRNNKAMKCLDLKNP